MAERRRKRRWRGGEEVGGTWHNFRKLQFCDGLEHWWPAASARPSLDKDTTLLRTWPGSLASVGMGESLVTGQHQHCFSLSQGIYRFSLSQYIASWRLPPARVPASRATCCFRLLSTDQNIGYQGRGREAEQIPINWMPILKSISRCIKEQKSFC